MLTREKRVTAGTPRRVIALQVAVVLAVCGIAYALAYHLGERDNWVDHQIYYSAIRWVYDGNDLYDFFRHPPRKEGFTYPPFAALVMLPMGLLSNWLAIMVSQVMIAVTTVAIAWFLVTPIADRRGWPRWFAVGIAAPLMGAVGPVRETFEMGQVGWYLVGLILIDVWALRTGRKWAGVGIGIAAAIKITPGFFLLYLLVTRQWRAAGMAVAAGVTATLAGALISPATTWRFWTETLWDTTRVGNMGSGRNQSVTGLISHITSEPGEPAKALWFTLAFAVLALTLWRAWRAHRAGDELAAFTITGIGCAMLSPISWGHHLVWVVPGLVLLVDAALPADGGFRLRPALVAVAGYTLFASGAMHHFNTHRGGHYWEGGWVGMLGINSYVLGALALLALVPIRPGAPAVVHDPLDAELDAIKQPQAV